MDAEAHLNLGVASRIFAGVRDGLAVGAGPGEHAFGWLLFALFSPPT